MFLFCFIIFDLKLFVRMLIFTRGNFCHIFVPEIWKMQIPAMLIRLLRRTFSCQPIVAILRYKNYEFFCS